MREEAGEEAEAALPEPVVDPVEPESVEARIAEEDFGVRTCGGVALADGADVVADGLESGEHG